MPTAEAQDFVKGWAAAVESAQRNEVIVATRRWAQKALGYVPPVKITEGPRLACNQSHLGVMITGSTEIILTYGGAPAKACPGRAWRPSRADQVAATIRPLLFWLEEYEAGPVLPGLLHEDLFDEDDDVDPCRPVDAQELIQVMRSRAMKECLWEDGWKVSWSSKRGEFTFRRLDGRDA